MLRVAFFSLALLGACFISPARADERPNIIYILCDDLAQGDLGCYGQKLIQTPRLDQMAAEGTRYTQAYSGTSVCAPSRASLMTGLHTGHSPVRANYEAQPEGQWPLPPGQPTLASLLKLQGYSTACVGKWGMGMFHTTGSPLKVGFDHFYGYNCQRHAHSYFPTYLYNDDQRFELPGNDGKEAKVSYSQNYLADETLKWVRDHKADPFFLFYAATLPHNKMEIDDLGIYKDKPWTEKQKTYAAMVTRLDSDVGRLLDLLKELNLDKKTLVIFTGDNGSQQAPDSEIGKFFNESMDGKLRGFKRSLYEGGLRQAAISWWPGTVPAGRVSDEPWAFWDMMPTVAELAGSSSELNPDTGMFAIVANQKDHADLWGAAEKTLEDADSKVVKVGNAVARWVPIATDAKGKLKVAFPGTSQLIRELEDDGKKFREILVVLNDGELNAINVSLIEKATKVQNDVEQLVIHVEFDETGAKEMQSLTYKYKPSQDGFRRQLGLVFLNKVYSAPYLNEVISDQAQISGSMTEDELDDVLTMLWSLRPPTDGYSLVSFLKGGHVPERESFYWELHEGLSLQAVRFGDYKAIRQGPGKPLELYNLADDVSEKNDIAKKHPELIQRAESLMASSHKDDPVWPMVNNAKERKQKREAAGVIGP